MTAAEPREAMIGAASVAGLPLEPSLVETVLAISATSRGPCRFCPTPYSPPGSGGGDGCWARPASSRPAGVRQTIAHSAERVFGALSPTQQGIAKDVSLRLTALGDGTQDTRAGACGGLSWWPAEAPRPSRWSLSGWLRRAW
jgi:hypothetical protein